MPFYGIYVPGKEGDSPYVFNMKSKALDVLKLNKEARLREFSYEAEAFKFAQTGQEATPQSKHSDEKCSNGIVQEKAAFRGPTKQELVEFRKAIENGNYDRVKTMIWDNPRYLVSSGDTPTTLKEGYRYNAIHVCSISKKARIAELILQTVRDKKFVDLLTGKNNDDKMWKELSGNLLDYYLNIPEKGRSETPLHLAAKYGAVEMVEVLTSYPECRMTRNKEGLFPKDIICSRAMQSCPELAKKIDFLLKERFYVPVLRCVDNAIPPKIGQPFSSSDPPNFNCDPMSPEVKIQAIAGPMNQEQAKQFCRRWKTPPRLGSNTSSPVAHNLFISPVKSRTTTPTKYKSSVTPTLKSKPRSLFNSTPHSSPHAIPADCSNSIGEVTDSEYTSLADKQNGNQPISDITNEVTKNSANAPEVGKEANNNIKREQADKSDGILKTITSHNTPVLQMKRELFFTYRNETDSNDSIDSLPDENNTSPFSGDERVENQQPNRPIKLKGSMLKTALCRKMQPFKENITNLQDQSSDSPKDTDYNYDLKLYSSDGISTEDHGFKERHIKITDTEKGLEVIGRELAKEQNIEWREYWDFLDSFLDIASTDGLLQLESYLARRLKEEEISKKTAQAVAKSAVILDNVCNALEQLNFPEHSGLTDGRIALGNRFINNSNNIDSSKTAVTAPQSETPYTCVEKSVQVFAKRMTKTIVHNVDNVVAINDALLIESKRLKSLISSFKDDPRFLTVNFTKVHSRIGNLISIYLENSQEVTPVVKLKIQGIMKNLLAPAERREHIECVCWRILSMLECPIDQILPENLKTEEMCSKVWGKEEACDCQWETNLSRKTSRRNRMEARYRSHQQHRKTQNTQNNEGMNGDNMQFNDTSDISTDVDQWRDPLDANDETSDNDVFLSGESGSEDQDEMWYTPAESPSRIEENEEESYKYYIYGDEPTKRDVDVLNAIRHVELDVGKFPLILAWKEALLRFSKEEMETFSSLGIVKKSHSFIARTPTRKEVPQTPPSQREQISQNSMSTPTSSGLTMQIPTNKRTAKRLFARQPLSSLLSPFSVRH